MQHHRSIGTTSLVALMAAHRQAQRRPLRNGTFNQDAAGPQLDRREIDRIAEQLWQAEAAPEGPMSAPA